MNYKVLSSVLVLISCALSSEAYAVCTVNRNFTTVDISMAVGAVTVLPSDPVGKVLVKSTFPIPSTPSAVSCDYGTRGWVDAVIINNTGLAPGAGPNVYKTNISGIGIRLYREAIGGANFSGYYPYSRQLDRNQNYNLGEGFFVVEIIKTAAATGNGKLQQGLYSSYNVRGSESKPLLRSSIIGDAITITSSSCEVTGNKNKTVELPTVNKSGFTGVGSTQGEQAFDLNIKCNGGANLTVPEKIGLTFDYDAAANTTDVLANSAPQSTRAKGVGTQLVSQYQGSNNILAKNEKVALGSLAASANVEYNIPLVARYYQTETGVTGGTVKSTATVTIEYD